MTTKPATQRPTRSDGEPHRARRPEWRCTTDGLPWPCEPGRRALRQQRADDPLALQIHMPRLMATAAGDLGLTNPTWLYRRFVHWTLDKDEACRICGKPGHTALPGLPPRLTPCTKLHGPASNVSTRSSA